MATVTQENIGMLHERLTVKLEKTDYLPAFEKALKDYSKKANIPGFRKGHVPAGLIKKMYGNSVFSDEVLRSVDRELIKFIETDKLNIFAQPLPMAMDMHQLDMNNPADYTFHFEVGMKPEFQLANLGAAKITRYKVDVTEEMIDNEITRLQNRYGNMKDEESVNNDDNVLNVLFIEVDANGNEIGNGIRKDNSLLVKYFREGLRKELMGKKVDDFITTDLSSAFDEKEREWIIGDLGLSKDDAASQNATFKIQITKIGLLEKRKLNEEFFNQLYSGQEIKTDADFRNKIREEIQAYWDNQAHSQVEDQAYHELIDHSKIDFPELFLKKWIKAQGDQIKTDEQVNEEFPIFINQLKWTLITDKIVNENNIQVLPDDIRNFARQQLFGYMGMSASGDDQGWVNDYIERMMKDRKYVEDAYNRIQTENVLGWTETQVKPTDQSISAEEFTRMMEAHQHHHH
jgi:trigger factor